MSEDGQRRRVDLGGLNFAGYVWGSLLLAAVALPVLCCLGTMLMGAL